MLGGLDTVAAIVGVFCLAVRCIVGKTFGRRKASRLRMILGSCRIVVARLFHGRHRAPRQRVLYFGEP